MLRELGTDKCLDVDGIATLLIIVNEAEVDVLDSLSSGVVALGGIAALSLTVPTLNLLRLLGVEGSEAGALIGVLPVSLTDGGGRI